MTEPYDWNPMPHKVAVRCPDCQSEAKFEFAEYVVIRERKDVPFFQNSKIFEHTLESGGSGTGKKHLAWFYYGLNGTSEDAIQNLPEGYNPTNWSHSKYWSRNNWARGAIV